MNIYRPFKDLDADQTLAMGNDGADAAFDIEDAMDDVLKNAKAIVNKLNALHNNAQDIASESEYEGRNLVQMAEDMLILASSIKTVTMDDVGDWDQALADAQRAEGFDPRKEWGTL